MTLIRLSCNFRRRWNQGQAVDFFIVHSRGSKACENVEGSRPSPEDVINPMYVFSKVK